MLIALLPREGPLIFNSAFACMLSLTLGTPVAMPTTTPSLNNLRPFQTRELVSAKEHSKELQWRLFNTTVNGQPRSVILLGEVHFALPEDLRLGNRVINQYENLATENGDTNDDPSWSWKMMPVASALVIPSVLTFVYSNRRELESPMDHAKQAASATHVHNVEQLHQPTWIEEAALVNMGILSITPYVVGGAFLILVLRTAFGGNARRLGMRFGKIAAVNVLLAAGAVGFNVWADDPLVTGRDPAMAQYIDQWFKDPKSPAGPLLVIVGADHIPGVSQRLTNYGFVEQSIDGTLNAAPVRRGLPQTHPL